jgi:hypothetical protein
MLAYQKLQAFGHHHREIVVVLAESAQPRHAVMQELVPVAESRRQILKRDMRLVAHLHVGER